MNDSPLIATPNPHSEARAALAARLAVEDRQAGALETIAVALAIIATDDERDSSAKRALRHFLEQVREPAK